MSGRPKHKGTGAQGHKGTRAQGEGFSGAWYDGAVRRFFFIAPLLAALALGLSACSPASILPSSTLVGPTPTAAPPTPLPTAAPLSASSATGFDHDAGNCADAANTAITLIGDAGAGRFGGSVFSMDMRLDLEPHDANSHCADPPATIDRHFRAFVNSAQLTVWTLDSQWSGAYSNIRQQWLADVLNTLLRRYPIADINVRVLSNGVQCGAASIGAGRAGTRQINPNCV